MIKNWLGSIASSSNTFCIGRRCFRLRWLASGLSTCATTSRTGNRSSELGRGFALRPVLSNLAACDNLVTPYGRRQNTTCH
jgi:hypothetical protein